MAVDRNHSWPRATFFAISIAICICVDILQHSAPLPFLPQQLEAEGHSSMEIASVMGSYYWSGFTGGLLITTYQIHGLLFGKYVEPTWTMMRKHVVKLMVGLVLGGLSLVFEAQIEHRYMLRYATMHSLHLGCRFLQGFVGAFLFFYAYLLAATAFEGGQQVFALTACTIFLNVAEVFGPFVGAWIFTAWGMDAAYYTLAALSLANNVLLFAVWWAFPVDDMTETSPLMSHREGYESTSPEATPRERPRSPRAIRAWGAELGRGEMLPFSPSGSPLREVSPRRWERLTRVLTDTWLLRSLLVIAPAAMVKSSFESILPLFGDNHGYSEFDVGILFTVVALGFIVAAISTGYLWEMMSKFCRSGFVALSLLMLGCLACVMLLSYGVDDNLPVASTVEYLNGRHHYLFTACLAMYGVLLGITHTAASLYLGEVVEELHDERSKGAANGVWNTGWELGGSLGFVIAGLADTDSWRQEQMILRSLGIVLIVASMAFAFMAFRPAHGGLASSPPSGPRLSSSRVPSLRQK